MNDAPLRFRIPVDHPAFPGHFPGTPLLPGASLLDEVLRRLPCGAADFAWDAATIEVPTARFVSAALPGEELELHHTASDAQSWRFEVRVGQRLVMNGSVRLKSRPRA